jgi:RNA polymerase sigma-70 factor (ECF subfamily)
MTTDLLGTALGDPPGVAPRAADRDSDEALALRAAEGDRGAFASLVDRYQDRIYRFALVRLRCEHDACEAAQETLLRAWRFSDRYRAPGPYAPWILSIAHREIVNVLRGRRRRERSSAVAPDSGPEPVDVALPDLWRIARDTLDDAAFELIWLRYAEGLEPSRIALVTGRSAVGVRVALHRARSRLAAAVGGVDGAGHGGGER